MAPSPLSATAAPAGSLTHFPSTNPTFCSGSAPNREVTSSGRSPSSSDCSATRAARFADRTEANVATARMSVPAAVASAEIVTQSQFGTGAVYVGKAAPTGTETPMVPDVTPGETREQRWERRLQVPMLIASLAVIPLVIIAADNFSPEVERIGRILNWGTWVMFVGEIVIMLAVTENRRRWLRTHPAELIATVLSPPILPGPLQAVRFLRVLRLARLAVTVQELRRFLSPDGIRDAALVTVFVVLAGGVAFSQVERAQHLSAWDGVWWAMSTITTVGYGDVTPHTVAGRLIAIVDRKSGV